MSLTAYEGGRALPSVFSDVAFGPRDIVVRRPLREEINRLDRTVLIASVSAIIVSTYHITMDTIPIFNISLASQQGVIPGVLFWTIVYLITAKFVNYFEIFAINRVDVRQSEFELSRAQLELEQSEKREHEQAEERYSRTLLNRQVFSGAKPPKTQPEQAQAEQAQAEQPRSDPTEAEFEQEQSNPAPSEKSLSAYEPKSLPSVFGSKTLPSVFAAFSRASPLLRKKLDRQLELVQSAHGWHASVQFFRIACSQLMVWFVAVIGAFLTIRHGVILINDIYRHVLSIWPW